MHQEVLRYIFQVQDLYVELCKRLTEEIREGINKWEGINKRVPGHAAADLILWRFHFFFTCYTYSTKSHSKQAILCKSIPRFKNLYEIVKDLL